MIPRKSITAAMLVGLCCILQTTIIEAQNTSIIVCFPPASNIQGNVTLNAYPKCIGALSASSAVMNSGATATGGGAGAGKAQLSPVTFTKNIDAASPVLFLSAVKGTRIPTADVIFVTPTGDVVTEIARLTLSDVAISQIKQTGTDGSLPIEEVSLTFGKMCVTSKNTTTGGAAGATTTGCFDAATGAAS